MSKSFTCPRCDMTSHNPNDAREGYCGNCHDWTRVSARMNCPYCNHDPLGHEITGDSLRVRCRRCLGGFCGGR